MISANRAVGHATAFRCGSERSGAWLLPAVRPADQGRRWVGTGRGGYPPDVRHRENEPNEPARPRLRSGDSPDKVRPEGIEDENGSDTDQADVRPVEKEHPDVPAAPPSEAQRGS